MHLVYVARHLKMGEEGEAGGENEDAKAEEVTQLAPCRGQFPARHGRASLHQTGS